MERDYESNSSHLCTSRTSLWCPICGAVEGRSCTEVEGLRFSGHNLHALGAPKPVQIPTAWEPTVARKDAPRPGWTPAGWEQ
jgi:hypothetical protein